MLQIDISSKPSGGQPLFEEALHHGRLLERVGEHRSAVQDEGLVRVSLVPAPEKPKSAASPVAEPSELVHKDRVLIAEDDLHLRMVLRMVLEKGGYDVSEARNGREALEVMAAMPVALVIADMRMPLMTGAEMAVSIRSNLATTDVPILMMSGYADQTPCGASAWLRKPFEADRLLALAASLIGSGQL